MQVMHVITGLGRGGAETMLVNLASRGVALGYPQRVVSLLAGGAHVETLGRAGVPVESLGMTSGRPSASAVLRLSRLMRRHRPQIVQGWMYHANLTAWAARALVPGSARPKLVWGLRCSDMDTRHYPAQLRWVIRAGAWLSRRPDMVIANSEAGARDHEALGYRNARLMVIPNGIDTDRFRPDADLRAAVRAELGIDPDKAVVVLLARVDAMKDHATFLAAMARNPDLQALLIGRDTEKLDLPPNVSALGLRGDVDRLLPACDVIALSSAFGEGFPNALAEGMAAGLVPVATDVGDSRGIIGDTGHVVRPGDPEGLATALADAVREARSGRGAVARRRIEEQFGIQRAAQSFFAAYESLG